MAQDISKYIIAMKFALEGAGATKAEINAVFAAINKLPAATSKATGKMNDFTTALRRAAIVAPVWMALRFAMQSVLGLIQDQAKFLVDMENAMVRIQIVGKGTTEELNTLAASLVGLARVYGITASEALDAAVLFAQQGRTVDETIALTRAAMIGAQVLGENIKDTVNNLTAAIEGFNIPIENATSIVDKWINVEKQFAVTSKDLADAIKVAGATANQLGISISQFLGDVTAVIEVTRKSGSEAARGLSFIYARLYTTAKTTIQQLAQVKFYLDEQGKATNELTNTLRPASDILAEIASKWKDLTQAERLAIAEQLGSKRQLTVVNALFQNYTASIEANIAALTSAGQAHRAFLLTQDTVAVKTKILATSWNLLTSAIADTSSWKGSLDVLSNFLLELTKAIDAEKAFRASQAKTTDETLNLIETRKNELASLTELIDLRKRLNNLPQTVENTDRLKQVQEAIQAIANINPRIKLAVETETPEQISKMVQELVAAADVEALRANISLKFKPVIDALELQKFYAQRNIDGKSYKQSQQDIVDIDIKIAEANKQMTEEINKQSSALTTAKINKELIKEASEAELELSVTLDEKEKEKLEIERELLKIKLDARSTDEQIVQKQIELTKNSKFQLDDRQKLLETEKLQNDLVEARLRTREKERQSVQNLLFQLAQANEAEQDKIIRQIELRQMSKQDVVSAFANDDEDKALILKNITDFTSDVQDSIAQLIASEAGIAYEALNEDVKRATGVTPGTGAFAGQKYGGASPIPPGGQSILNNNTITVQVEGTNIEIVQKLADENAEESRQKIIDIVKTEVDKNGSVLQKAIEDQIEKY